MKTFYECIVIGAGPAGSTAATLLARNGIDTLLIDKENFPREKVCGDCLTPTAVKSLLDESLLKIDEINGYKLKGLKIITSDLQTNTTDFDFKGAYPGYALVVRRKELDHHLLKKAEEAGCRVLLGFEVKKINEKEKFLEVVIKKDEEELILESKIVVVATGNSIQILKNSLNVSYKDYGAVGVAVRAYYETDSMVEPYMHIFALNETWPAMGWVFPVSERIINAGIGFYIDEKKYVGRSLSNSLDLFIKILSQRKEIFSKVRPIEKPKSLKILMGGTNKDIFRNGILACGEAAGLVNPFTGEGMGFAIRSGSILAKVVSYGLSRKLSTSEITRIYKDEINKEFATYMRSALILKRVASSKIVTKGVVYLLNRSKRLSQFNIKHWIKG
ncbi:MAG: NAD(P)/FAD-dependent oxidoreductase [Actinobacteria bacterium]|nr:NAD(P)/FAD-dependent oxidoreductase [Actinomycetota bacterium]